MRRRSMLFGLTVCAAALPAAVWAQSREQAWSGFWTVRFESEPSGQALIDELPPGTVLIDDGGGRELAAGEYAGLTLTPRAIEEIENYDFAAELKRENTCVAPSAAFYMQAPFPMEIHAGRDLIVFKMEYFNMFRIVFLDGRDHPPAGAPHSKSGHSVGYWDDDGRSLVVDTTHLAPGTFMNNGFSHSGNLHMVERFRLSPDGSTLWATQVYEDPETFEGRAARYMAWRKLPGEYVYPYDCDPSFGE